MSSNALLISPKTFKDRTPAHTNTDDKLIYPIIKVVQDFRVRELLGSALFAKIQDGVTNANLSGDYLTLRDSYLIDVMIWLVMAEMPDTLQYQYANVGVVVNNADKTQSVDVAKLNELKNKYKSYAEFYIKATMQYLRENAKAKFPEYLAVITTLDGVSPTATAYTCPIYLGDESDYPYDNYSTRRRDANKGIVNNNYQLNNNV
jgi:hypothetical protein